MILIDNINIENYGFKVLRDGTESESPATRDRLVTIPGRDGAYDFGADLESRSFSIALRLKMQPDYKTFKKRMRQLKRLLFNEYGKPKNVTLEWVLNPGTFYIARYSGAFDVERIWTMGDFELPMVAFDPTAYQTIAAGNPDAIYGDGTELDMGEYYANPESVTFTSSPKPVTITNFGDRVIPLDLRITGAVQNPIIRNETTGQQLTINKVLNPTDVLAIDGKKGYVTLNGTNINNDASGTFPDLLLLENELVFEGTSPNSVITFTFNYQLN